MTNEKIFEAIYRAKKRKKKKEEKVNILMKLNFFNQERRNEVHRSSENIEISTKMRREKKNSINESFFILRISSSFIKRMFLPEIIISDA